MDNAIGNRIREMRLRKGLSQQELNKLLGWGATRLSMYERGERQPRIEFLRELASVLDCTIEDLLATASNVSPIQIKPGTVPVISWVQAGTWNDVEDLFLAGEADEWIPAQNCKPSKHAFALRVEGDSMTAASGLSFPEGCLIIVDPDRSANAGDYVVAKDVVTQRATFKRLTTDGGRWYLKPLNPAYPMIEIYDPAMRVIGVAIEWQMGGKL